MIDKRYRNEIARHIPPDLPYQFENGSKHKLLRINGHYVATLSNRSKIESGRAMQNIISSIKRFVRDLQLQDSTIRHR